MGETLPTKEWTHEALVERAGRWLSNSQGCKVVLTNPKPYACLEHPDAIGWHRNGESIIVECKISRADFIRDDHKNWRCMSIGMGCRKYYFSPEGVVEERMVPFGIGLLHPRGRRIIVKVEAHARQVRDWPQEIAMLLAQITDSKHVGVQVDNPEAP